ncbi:phosphodiesterase YaeI [Methylobrevis pamukkalensis]|uniref:Phosphodiesterase YaeI n=1 Tax=Methylobrevis pamukkalensis TaxID=1439726 RepID=A0A1E3GYI2_9HYPH|nr:phosphodiesterase YaeI [Methylobrevis pamukkalensis]
MITRRTFLKLVGGTAFSVVPMTTYAAWIEPRHRLVTTRYEIGVPGWGAAHGAMRIAVVADVHACEPWMPVSRIDEIVATTNALSPDLTLLLGDYVAGMRRFKTGDVPMWDWATALAKLEAPLGVHAVLGNHDWYSGGELCRFVLEEAGVPVMENDARRLTAPGGAPFWLAGLADQLAREPGRRRRGLDDLPGTLAKVTDDAPLILMAHEPDIFAEMPDRVGLTLCGHTHGGQVNLPFIGELVVPSRFGHRYAYGHIVEDAGSCWCRAGSAAR